MFIMKDYDNVIIWLDYYNKGLSRTKGRRISKSLAIYDPSIPELMGAAVSLGYNITEEQVNDNARYPRRPYIKSGYIMIPKDNLMKNNLMKDIAEKLFQNRSKQKNK